MHREGVDIYIAHIYIHLKSQEQQAFKTSLMSGSSPASLSWTKQGKVFFLSVCEAIGFSFESMKWILRKVMDEHG